jgi:hypothetical protein
MVDRQHWVHARLTAKDPPKIHPLDWSLNLSRTELRMFTENELTVEIVLLKCPLLFSCWYCLFPQSIVLAGRSRREVYFPNHKPFVHLRAAA